MLQMRCRNPNQIDDTTVLRLSELFGQQREQFTMEEGHGRLVIRLRQIVKDGRSNRKQSRWAKEKNLKYFEMQFSVTWSHGLTNESPWIITDQGTLNACYRHGFY
jgi:hypothetical protein